MKEDCVIEQSTSAVELHICSRDLSKILESKITFFCCFYVTKLYSGTGGINWEYVIVENK